MQLRLTPVVKALLIACFAMFLLQQTIDQFLGGDLLGWLALVPSAFVVEHRFWQLFTYPFLHGDVMHLFFNLLVLAFIGGELELVWGRTKFIKFFFACTTGAGLLYLFLQLFVWKGPGLHMPMVGASGGIYGMLIAYGILFSERVLLFMMVFPMRAKHFVWVLAGLEFMTTVFSGKAGGGLGSAAHLGGMVTGFLYLWLPAYLKIMQKKRADSSSSSRRSGGSGGPGGGGFGGFRKPGGSGSKSHLKLVIDNKGNKPGGDPKGKNVDRLDRDTDNDPKTWH